MPDQYTIEEIQGFLRELVGPQGAYVLMVDVPGKGPDSDVHVGTWGPFTRLLGLLSFGGALVEGRNLTARVDRALASQAERDQDPPTQEAPE